MNTHTATRREAGKVRLIDAKEIREKIKEKFSIPFAPSPMSINNYAKLGKVVKEQQISMWDSFPRVPNLLTSYEQSDWIWNHTYSYYYLVYEIFEDGRQWAVEYVLEDFTTIPWYYAD